MAYLHYLRSNISSISRRKFIIAAIAASSLLLSGPMLIRRMSVDERAFLFRGQMILLLEAVVFTGSWYVWITLRHLLDSISTGSRGGSIVYCTWFTKLAVAVMLCLAQLSLVINNFVYGEDPPLLSIACFACLGVLVQFVICYFCLNRAHQLIDWATVLFFAGNRVQHSKSVHWMKFIIASLFSISISAYGLCRGSQAPVIKTVEVPVKGLATSMDRLSVAAVADIHLGPTVGRTKLERVVHMVNSLKPGLYRSLFIYTLFTLAL